MLDTAIIGAGYGGLSAAIRMAAAGKKVAIFEAQTKPGGKASEVFLDGIYSDTGPSVLTMPHVLDELLQLGGTRLGEAVILLEKSPSFRYIYPDGCQLDIFPKLTDTLKSVEQTLGNDAKEELESFLKYAKTIVFSFVVAFRRASKNP